MNSIRSKIVDLVSVAGKAEKTLKAISLAATSAAKLRTGVVLGALGFCVGAGGTFGALAAASMLFYAPFAVPLGGVCGLLLGIIAGRDGIDRSNERAIDLVDRAWMLRDREVENLTRQIKAARRDRSPRLLLLEQKLTFLDLAPPDKLIEYYGLSDIKGNTTGRQPPILGPDEQQIQEAWRPSVRQLTDGGA